MGLVKERPQRRLVGADGHQVRREQAANLWEAGPLSAVIAPAAGDNVLHELRGLVWKWRAPALLDHLVSDLILLQVSGRAAHAEQVSRHHAKGVDIAVRAQAASREQLGRRKQRGAGAAGVHLHLVLGGARQPKV